MFIERLRKETEDLHRALEHTAVSKALMLEGLAIEDYTRYLETLYGFVAVFEDEVYPMLNDLMPGIDTRRKAGLLRQDLAALGRNIDAIPLVPTDTMRQAYANEYAALGGLYVLEGSTLGGMVILKHVQARLGDVLIGGMNYFSVYGANTGTQWKAFLQQFKQLAEESQREEVVIEGAKRTFEGLREWMSRSRYPAQDWNPDS